MTLAEQLRAEVNIIKDIPWLQDAVADRIRNEGEFCIICDKHIHDISRTAIPYKYWNSVEQWAKEEGFVVGERYNSHGVKYLTIRL